MLLQVISHAPTFYAAVQKMQRALYEFTIRGVKTNILFLENVLRHPEFLSGTATTSFIERNPSLFQLTSGSALQSSKLLTYLAEMVVNGPQHPGATGPPPTRVIPAHVPHPTGPPPGGWRSVLLEQGPEGWAQAVRAHQGVLLTDTTWCAVSKSIWWFFPTCVGVTTGAMHINRCWRRAFALWIWWLQHPQRRTSLHPWAASRCGVVPRLM